MARLVIKFLITCYGIMLLATGMFAQSARTPLLERTLTISFEQETLEAALKKISQQGGFTFSYSPAVVKAERVVTVSFVNKTVRQILDDLFQGTVEYKQRGNYIILTRGESGKNLQKVSGYVVDEATGTRLKNVSVYDPVSLTSTITDSYGYFSIDLPEPSDEVNLAVRKQNYTDTLIAVPRGRNGLVNIGIKTKRIGVFADSVGSKMKRFWFTTKNLTQRAINFENISDTLHRSFQFSLVPFVGTNHKLSDHVINDYSLNLFGGYSLGTEKLEVGGLFNTERAHIRGVQIAGLVNGVAGDLHGVQFAGMINANRGKAQGAQVAGMINFNWDSAQVVAVAGLINFRLRQSRGMSIAGIANTTIKSQTGPSVAGIFNFSGADSGPAQVSGLFNFTTGDMRGVQLAGLLNFTAGKITGAQAGLINYGTKVRGLQLGVFNIADSMAGVPIGFLSIVAKGYHSIEISADEVFYTNIAFRTGVREFYNIFAAGAQPQSFSKDKTVWTFGYGVGTAPRVSKRLYLNADLTSNQVVNGSSIDAINLINKLYLGIEFKASRNLALICGATLNAQVTKTSHEGYPQLFTDNKPTIFYTHEFDNNRTLQMWCGGKIGLRFL